MGQYADGQLISIFPSVGDPTGQIVASDETHIQLDPGTYLVSYGVSVIFRTPSYMQVTPFYNGVAHLETGIYFATSANGSSASGSAHFILVAAQQTLFSLTFNSSSTATDGAVTLSFLKLNTPG